MTPEVTDPVLFLRMFEMLNDVGGELGHQELDAAARQRAAQLLREARRRLPDALGTEALAELRRMDPDLPDDPTTAGLRLAYRGILAWLEGLVALPDLTR